MKYSVYAVTHTETGPAILISEAEADEIGCDACGAHWLHDGTGSLVGCPYCGDDELNFGEVGLYEQSGRSGSYGRDLRGIVRGLWSGAFDINQAFSLYSDTVRIGLTRAWHEGAAQCGISPAELSPAELVELGQVIAREDSHIFPFMLFIEQNSKANGGKLAQLLSRVNMWALRYDDVATRAKLLACSDQKLEWVQGPTSDKCATCTAMNGKVKRASYWRTSGPHPRAPYNETIQCHGWNCMCEFVVTDKPMSRGPLPRWP